MKYFVSKLVDGLEYLLGLGGMKRDIAFLIISGVALLLSLFDAPLPFSAAWVAIILCGVPIVTEAFIGIITKFDIKADLLVSLALIASVIIGEDFAAGEVFPQFLLQQPVYQKADIRCFCKCCPNVVRCRAVAGTDSPH